MFLVRVFEYLLFGTIQRNSHEMYLFIVYYLFGYLFGGLVVGSSE